MNLTEQEIEKLKACKTQAQWNTVCDEVKRARGGQYPPDWYAEVHGTGMMAAACTLPK